MKIEAGKRYVTRDGRVTTELFRSAIYPDQFEGYVMRNDGILGSYKAMWMPGGCAIGYAAPGPHDLISEHHEPKPKPVPIREWLLSQISYCETVRGHSQGFPHPYILQKIEAYKLALERLDQIAAEKPKETVADNMATIVLEEHSTGPAGTWPKTTAKRILHEVVQPMLVTAYKYGLNNRLAQWSDEKTPAAYAARTIKEACGE